jgi:quercetin dioxygenase-like cupin family protein
MTGSNDRSSAHYRKDCDVKVQYRRATLVGLGLALCFGAMPADAQDTSAIIKLPQEIVFKGPLSGPPQTVVVFGDPTKPGVFVSRVKFSAGWKDPPHWHPDEVRTAVVLSGTLYFGTGEEWDESKFKAYPAGTFYSEPSKAPHFTWAKDGEVIIQVTGVGPSGKTPIKK